MADLEIKEVKPITLTDNVNGDVFVLEFNRDTIKFAESKGFDINVFSRGVNMTAIEEIFWYSFRMHQPKISKADSDKILYEKLGGMPEGMLERLTDLYYETFNALVQDEDKSKNATMTVTF